MVPAYSSHTDKKKLNMNKCESNMNRIWQVPGTAVQQQVCQALTSILSTPSITTITYHMHDVKYANR